MTNNTKILALFPGQGSQKVGMGEDTVNNSELGKELFQLADSTLGFALSKICFEGPVEKLTETAISQPAILTVSSILFRLFQDAHQGSYQIVGGAGHSLGEYSALVAAGAISFEDAVQLVHKRGSYMQEAVPAGEGAMAAVLGKEVEEIEEAISKTEGIVEIANLNAPGQIVISGSTEGVKEFKDNLGEAKFIPLQVSAPFHCSLMKPAAEKLAEDLDKTEIKTAEFPVYVNYSAEPITDPEAIRQSLKDQVCGRVRWTESIENALGGSATPDRVVELGAGKVLTGLMKRISRGTETTCIDGIEGVKSYSF